MLSTYLLCGFLYWILDCIIFSHQEGGRGDFNPFYYIYSLVLLLATWPIFLTINTFVWIGAIRKSIEKKKVNRLMNEIDKEDNGS